MYCLAPARIPISPPPLSSTHTSPFSSHDTSLSRLFRICFSQHSCEPFIILKQSTFYLPGATEILSIYVFIPSFKDVLGTKLSRLRKIL